MALIELKDINKSFRDGDARINHVLRGVNLSVECGDFVAIEGASGSGKTTLLNILGTLIEFDSGTYELNGTPITPQSVSLPKLRNKDIGFVFPSSCPLWQLHPRRVLSNAEKQRN